jgi:hypothetical protein
MKILLGDSMQKLEEHIFKPTIENESLYEKGSNNGDNVRLKLSLCFNCAPRYEGVLGELRYSSTHSLISARSDIHKYIWTSDSKAHNQFDDVLIDEKGRSSVVDIHLTKT